jgi:hypothetical protein
MARISTEGNSNENTNIISDVKEKEKDNKSD